MTKTGRIRKIQGKPFGFIRVQAEKEDVFFHESSVQETSFAALKEGDVVTFEAAPNPRMPGKLLAVWVQLANVPSSHGAGSATLDADVGATPSAPGEAGAQGVIYPPYRFVPVETPIEAPPVWHDGSYSAEPTYSGELLCSLEALTPLLVGNRRYPFEEADQSKFEDWNMSTDESGKPLDPTKKIVEPLRLPDGRVVLSGASLKGMLRHSIGALLSAPMERVAERHYTYRQSRLRAAIVESVGPEGIRVRLLPRKSKVIFCAPSVERCLGDPGKVIQSIDAAQWKKRTIGGTETEDRSRVVKANGQNLDLKGKYRIVSYRGGIDGTGKLAYLFAKKGSDDESPEQSGAESQVVELHQKALVCVQDIPNGEEDFIVIPTEVIRHYEKTQDVLADAQQGHLSAHPKAKTSHVKEIIARDFKRNRDWSAWVKRDHLIYVRLLESKQSSNVVAFGHNYHSRQAYTSSVRTKSGKLRGCLSPTEREVAADGPLKLTGARGLFGYVTQSEPDCSEVIQIGSGVHKRLAGRISINHAVSDAEPKFLGDDKQGYCIPLPLQGSPKASSWEFYLRQRGKSGLPKTYGDVPGDPGGDLAGRKFFLHQPRVQMETDLRANTLGDKNATLARFICKTGTRFRFTVRFARLRAWELAALAACMEPQRLDDESKHHQRGSYALKLGMGRPLGMGSVRVKIHPLKVRADHETRLRREEPAWLDRGQAGLRKMLNPTIVKIWSEIHRFADRGRASYPVARNKKTREVTVYEWHTQLHREYSLLWGQDEPDDRRIEEIWESIRAAQTIPPPLKD